MDTFKELNSENTLEFLRAALFSGDSLYFAGAGCSQGLGFPGWGKLIENLVESLTQNQVQNNGLINYLDLALEVKKFLQNTNELQLYHSYLHGRFSVPPRKSGFQKDWPDSNLHRLMLEFPVRSIITTNYDHAFEYYAKEYDKNVHIKTVLPDNEGSVGDFLFGLKDRRNLQSVFHLHGDYERASSIILARDDYDKAYKQNRVVDGQKVIGESLYRKVLWTLLTTRCLIFIGFSLTDDYLNEILKEVCADVWGNFKERHFALVPYDPDKKDLLEAKKAQFLKDYSIQTVFYNEKNYHEELPVLLQWLLAPKPVEERRLITEATAVVEPVAVAESEEIASVSETVTKAGNLDIFEKMKKMNKQAVPSHE
ncbi:hypothetical protein CIK05_06210 [Bdellovibrio sp. qaytius]|nr:hypothetical protein CIK05_06210 [Bdellovibrio sp. qaytius]